MEMRRRATTTALPLSRIRGANTADLFITAISRGKRRLFRRGFPPVARASAPPYAHLAESLFFNYFARIE
jgi:hypothetical protein